MITNFHRKIDTFKDQHPLWHVIFETCMLFILTGLAFFVIRTMMSWRLSLPAEIVRHLFAISLMMLLLAVLIAYTAIKPTKTKVCICLGLFTGLFFWNPSPGELLDTGFLYAVGKKNEEYAEACFRKAAELGEEGIVRLYYWRVGCEYAFVEKDDIEAERWFCKAVAVDPENYASANTYYLVGLVFAQGSLDAIMGDVMGDAEAEKWFRKAGELNVEDYSFARCCFLTGKAYALGDGVEINSAEAEKWFRKAAEEGDEFPIARSYRLMETEWNARDGEDAVNESAKWKRKADDAEQFSQP